MTVTNNQEDTQDPERELRAAEAASSPEQRRQAFAEPIARVVEARRAMLSALTELGTITETGDAMAGRALALATELRTTTTARKLGHGPWRALLLDALANEGSQPFDLGALLAAIPNAADRAHAIGRCFSAAGVRVVGMRPEEVATILLENFDPLEPGRRQEAIDAPIRAALVAAAEAERQRERELVAARKWKADRDAKLMHAARARGDVIAASNAREQRQRDARERRDAEQAELDEFRAALVAGEANNINAATAAGAF